MMKEIIKAAGKKLPLLSHKRKEDKRGEEENVMMERMMMCKRLGLSTGWAFERAIRQEKGECV